MKTIAITGGIGSGKSAVSGYLKGKGYTVIDADAISRNLTAPGSDALMEIKKVFGSSVFNTDGALNRAALADIVFKDGQMLEKLNYIMHPKILDKLQSEIFLEKARLLKIDNRSQMQQRVIFAEVPLLYELGWQQYFDCVWLVVCPRKLRIERAVTRDNSTAEKVQMRIDNQADMDKYLSAADKVIDNSGSIAKLHKQIDALITGL